MTLKGEIDPCLLSLDTNSHGSEHIRSSHYWIIMTCQDSIPLVAEVPQPLYHEGIIMVSSRLSPM